MATLTRFLLSAAIAILLPLFGSQHDIASGKGKTGKSSRPHNGAAAQSSADNPLPALLSSIAALDPAATVVIGGSAVTVGAASFIATAQGFLSTVNTASASAVATTSSAAASTSSSAAPNPTSTLPTVVAPSTSSTTHAPTIATTLSTQPSPTFTSSSSAVAAAAQSGSPSASSSSSSNSLTIGLGAGLGIPLAALLLAGLIFFLLRRRRQRVTRASVPIAVAQEPEKAVTPPRHGVSELGNDGQIVEASSVPDPVELSTVPYKGWVEPRKGAVEIG